MAYVDMLSPYHVLKVQAEGRKDGTLEPYKMFLSHIKQIRDTDE